MLVEKGGPRRALAAGGSSERPREKTETKLAIDSVSRGAVAVSVAVA